MAPHRRQFSPCRKRNGLRSPENPRSSLQIVSLDSLVLSSFRPTLCVAAQHSPNFGIHAGLKLTLVQETCLQLGRACQFTPHTHSINAGTPMEISRQRNILLPSHPKGFCRTGTWLLEGWQIAQLSCQLSSDVKPPRMLTQGETVLHMWKLWSSKKNPCTFYYTE